jgi:decaprenyl-phosphate phosphoribosyltransferase
VVAAAGAAGALGHDDVPVRVGLACLAFCLISAGTCALNDTRDAAEDRRHPRKRYRPVAAGELAPRDAVVLGAG